MDPKKNTGKKYFDVAPPSAKPITAPLINTQKRRILSRSNLIKDENEKVDINTLTGSTGNNSEGEAEVDDSLETKELADDKIKVRVEPAEKEESPSSDEQVTEKPTTEDAGEPNEEEAPLTDSLPDSREEDQEEVANLDDDRGIEPEAEADQKDAGSESEEQPATPSVDENKDDDNENNDDNDDDKEESLQELTDDEVQANTEEKDQEANETPQEQNVESETEPERTEPIEEEQETLENLTPVASRHSGVDTSTALASGRNSEMAGDSQAPKIYDTKEYHVPIGKAHHKHGGAKSAFVFGVICAVIVVVAIVAYLYYVGI
jgi:protein DEK